MAVQLLEKLVKRYTSTNPDVATTVEQSLIQLSSGIYTEEERFVFELLQNAVDAFNVSNGTLDIKMMIEDDYFVFMHNGDTFSERDIEGLCDVGNGNKVQDTKKIGYKGIGFKSVFMRSTCVTVESGSYCFQFNKAYWDGYWDRNWDTSYGVKDSRKIYLMPWQIIPIETIAPLNIDTSGYNVVTYIHTSNTTSLEKKIIKLLSSSQFLLFLKSTNIQMTFISQGQMLISKTKNTSDSQVILSSNGQEESRWLIFTNEEVKVPSELRADINADINTPQKLKDAIIFDLSFAIALDKNGKMQRLQKDDAVVYTYLPTSYKFGTEGFPFLVNANFITDAGRQQLHRDSEWNKLIFSKIPSEFLKWIATLSSTYKNYYEVLPEKTYGQANALEEVYATEMQKAIDTIAFIPTMNDTTFKILAKEAVMDKMEIADAISEHALIKHINKTYNHCYTSNNFVANAGKSYKILTNYGVFIFDKQKLKAFFDDKNAFEKVDANLDIKLIDFLFKYYLQNKNEQEELIEVLQSTRFLIDEDGILYKPSNLFFPSSYKEQNGLAEGTKILHASVNQAIESKKQEKVWLKKLGVEEMSDVTFIKNVICKDGYVSKENAIDIGRFLFYVNTKIDLFDEVEDHYLKNLKFLSTQGTLKSIGELYLSSIYNPGLNIENLFPKDIYVSTEYLENDNPNEWKLFFQKMGIVCSFEITEIKKELSDFESNIYDNIIVNSWEESKKLKNLGWEYKPQYIYIEYYPLISLEGSDIKFSKYFWNKIFKINHKEEDTSRIVGYYGLYWSFKDEPKIKKLVCRNFREYLLRNVQTYPATNSEMHIAKELFINSAINIELGGKYLPIIDIKIEINDNWQNILQLKRDVTISDLLFVLSLISKDVDNVDQNKNRICRIYERLVELGSLSSDAKKLIVKEWASNNTILSKDYKFVSPSELKHITLDGFGSNNRVYIGNLLDRSKIIELLALMGVKVITETSINPDYQGKRETDEIRKILMGKLSPLALVAAGEKPKETEYKEKKNEIHTLLSNTHFYHCDKIKLTYGNDEDVIEKHTFGNKNEFYYIGDLRPANVEPLLTPLCKYLHITGKERELFIMIIEDMEGLCQNLADKGYNILLIEEEPVTESGTIQVTLTYRPNETEQERNMITGFKGEIIVYEKLKSMGYDPICPSISTEEDYDRKIEYNGKTYFCKSNYGKYDIFFRTESGVQMFVEVKATTMSKSLQENMPISYRELSMVEECNNDEGKSYIIARVFGINQSTQDIYLFKGHILEN